MSSRELSEWKLYFELEPWGEEQADRRTGMLAAILANLLGGRRRSSYQPKDFMPKPLEERIAEEEASEEDILYDEDLSDADLVDAGRKRASEKMQAIVERWNAVLGGHDLRKDK